MAKVLDAYRAKRNFAKTPEPAGKAARKTGDRFVIQKHAARRLHYDFRLELDGVLKSWAVAKGPSLVAGEKRLAVHTEDHPLDYGNFEGVIPKGEYGGGTVLLWDRGRWIPEGDPRQGYADGKLAFRLEGQKLTGAWHLVRMRRRPREKQEQWLLIKSADEAVRPADEDDILDTSPLSVTTGRSVEQIAADPDRVWSTAPKDSPAQASSIEPKSLRGAQPAKLPAFVEPCLATPVAKAPEGAKWLHEIKFDGYRIQARLEHGAVTLRTRRGLDWTDRFHPVAKALAALPARAAILDGEVVVEGTTGIASFSTLQEDLSAGRTDRMIYYAFDLLHLDGFDLTRVPLIERKRTLAALLEALPADGLVRASEHLEADGQAMVRHACRLGLEGIISKRRDAAYRPGRSETWLKTKCVERQEFVIGGYVPSTTARRAIGSLILGYRDESGLVHAGRAGTGFTDAVARDLWQRLEPLKRHTPPFAERPTADAARQARWVEPELVAEIEFRGWTADGLLRHAAFRGLREDKNPAEVVRETPPGQAGPSAPSDRGGLARSSIVLTHPERVLWAGQGLTKQGLADFYAEIRDWILPHLVNRPLSLVRCPSGQAKACFFQKHAWAGLDEAVRQVTIPKADGAEGETEQVLAIDDLDGLIALVQVGVMEIHPWGATLDAVEHPDRLVFDLDPGDGVPWVAVIEGAMEVRDRLSDLGLTSFVKTTGGKGLHVVVPTVPGPDWAIVKDFCQRLAQAMAVDNPDRYTATLAKSARGGRIFVDYLRNGRGATAVAAYSSRARPGAPVATPLAWDELVPEVRPDHYTVVNLPSRLRHLDTDPWADLWTLRQSVDPAIDPGGRKTRRGPDAQPSRTSKPRRAKRF